MRIKFFVEGRPRPQIRHSTGGGHGYYPRGASTAWRERIGMLTVISRRGMIQVTWTHETPRPRQERRLIGVPARTLYHRPRSPAMAIGVFL